jgi:hypothetical protein
MISDVDSDSKMYANGSLLDEYPMFIQDKQMILLGDTAQLPPVNLILVH